MARRGLAGLAAGLMLLVAPVAIAAVVPDSAVARWPSVLIFLVLVGATLAITGWAARRTQTRADFYVAHGRITPLQNGFAIAGDYISAGAFLGNTALFFTSGPDAFIYLTGALVALLLMLTLVGGRLRELGRYSFADVCAARFQERPVRLAAGANSLAILLLTMVGQMVGAGALVQIVFGLPYAVAVSIVGGLMAFYVMAGGMFATTWVQIIKAVLLLIACTLLAVLLLRHFDFSLPALLAGAAQAHPRGDAILRPGGYLPSVGDALSLGMTLVLGPCGLPHILMRFFTVKDAAAARQSAFYAMFLIGFFYLLIPLFGLGAAAVLHLAGAIGGPVMFGLIGAVVFATTLAVASGLCLSAATTVAHDLYGRAFKRGAPISERQEMRVSRVTVAIFALLSVLLALAFQGQNIVFTVALGVSLAACSNFPGLMAAMYWPGATTRGIVWSSVVGLGSCLLLIVLGPSVWVAILGNPEPIFAYHYPTLISLPLAVLVLWLVSVIDRSPQALMDRRLAARPLPAPGS
jgi:cation/acetate symporter